VADDNERRRSDRDARVMSDRDLDAYIALADDAVLDCREGLHRFPRRSELDASAARIEQLGKDLAALKQARPDDYRGCAIDFAECSKTAKTAVHPLRCRLDRISPRTRRHGMGGPVESAWQEQRAAAARLMELWAAWPVLWPGRMPLRVRGASCRHSPAVSRTAAAALRPLRELVDNQREFADHMTRWAELQRELADNVAAWAAQQRQYADALDALLAPFLGRRRSRSWLPG
jgi:hypothetical protein